MLVARFSQILPFYYIFICKWSYYNQGINNKYRLARFNLSLNIHNDSIIEFIATAVVNLCCAKKVETHYIVFSNLQVEGDTEF